MIIFITFKYFDCTTKSLNQNWLKISLNAYIFRIPPKENILERVTTRTIQIHFYGPKRLKFHIQPFQNYFAHPVQCQYRIFNTQHRRFSGKTLGKHAERVCWEQIIHSNSFRSRVSTRQMRERTRSHVCLIKSHYF